MLGGFRAYVDKSFTTADDTLFRSIPKALAETEHVCASVFLGATRSGINMGAVARFVDVVRSPCRAWVRTLTAF